MLFVEGSAVEGGPWRFHSSACLERAGWGHGGELVGGGGGFHLLVLLVCVHQYGETAAVGIEGIFRHVLEGGLIFINLQIILTKCVYFLSFYIRFGTFL